MYLFRHRHFIESGRTSQADASGFVSTAFDGSELDGSALDGSLLAPAARMERENTPALVARADKSASPGPGRAPFGLHPPGAHSLRFAATAGAPA
ncbi:hypothetical protein [Lysobacter antibioticus]|uniref:hypothetical protein n=1 Tax=Lysobacter antibioticus TaxID=84531 RepID=UPI000B20DC32|nr:hypothetical protein [Lysobacter antibioticus]